MIGTLAQAAGGSDLGKLALTGLVTGAVSVVVTLLLARLTFQFVKRPELEQEYELKQREVADAVRAELDKERQRRGLDRAEAARRQVVNSAGPLLVAVEDLVARLDNILEETGFGPLATDWTPGDRQWSNTHAYFMGSTLYLWGRYFAWVQLIRERLGADEYLPQADKDRLIECLRAVSGALSSFPAEYNVRGCPGHDTQVFSWQQVAMGETLIEAGNGSPAVRSYADFVEATSSTGALCEPIRVLFVDLRPEPRGNCRWQRVTASRAALVAVRDTCRDILDIGPQPAE